MIMLSATDDQARAAVLPTQSWVRCSTWPGCIGKVFWVRFNAWIWDFVRHEALHYRMEVKRLHPRPVAAGWESRGQPGPGDAGSGGSSPDNDGTGRHCQTTWACLARREGGREEPAFKASQEIHRLQSGGYGPDCGARPPLVGDSRAG